MRKSLWPLAALYFCVSELRNRLYDWKVLSLVRPKAKVISVGNLSMGGTGKTPFVRYLAQRISKKGIGVAVIMRGYKGSVQQPHLVEPEGDSAAMVGDEALWMARHLSGTNVFVGPSKSQTAAYVDKNYHPEIILVDDGFQHRRLDRDLDLLVVDATQDHAEFQLFPMGSLREAKENSQRANLVVFSKANLVEREWLDRAKEVFVGQRRFSEIGYGIHWLKSLSQKEDKSFASLAGSKVFLLSAIGRPQGFEKIMTAGGAEILGHKIFSDHHFYEKSDVDNVLAEAERVGAEIIVATSKDAVKLAEIPIASGIWYVDPEVFDIEVSGLNEELSKLGI